MKIDHIAIWVHNLEAMKNFYVQYFGGNANSKYHNPNKNFNSYFIEFDTGCRLELMKRPDILESNFATKNKEYIGLTHFAMSVGTREKVDRLTELLRSDNFVVIGEPRTTGDGYYESVILDPEDNRVEITD
ncbi:MAG: VOC family protein [Reichenbachiella sp.]